MIYGPNTCCFLPNDLNILFKKETKETDLPIGVFFIKRGKEKPYGASISINNKTKTIGVFSTSTPEEAFYAYKEAKEDYIKEIANHYMYEKGGQYIPQYRDVVYPALLNYKIEIDD